MAGRLTLAVPQGLPMVKADASLIEQALATFKAEGARFAALVKKAGVTPQ